MDMVYFDNESLGHVKERSPFSKKITYEPTPFSQEVTPC